MGRRIWVVVAESERFDRDTQSRYKIPAHVYDIRVLSLKQFLPANGEIGRTKHLVQLWTDPGGMRTLSVGSLQLKDPKRVAAGIAREAARRG